MKLSFTNNNGTLPREIGKQITKYMKKTKGKLISIEYKFSLATRSIVQNSYYWGVVLKMISEETGYTPEELHEGFKNKFGYTGDFFGEPYKRSSTTYTTVEFEDYLLQIRVWAGEFLNMYIPLPNETSLNYYQYQ